MLYFVVEEDSEKPTLLVILLETLLRLLRWLLIRS
jgi:hypothetical protein